MGYHFLAYQSESWDLFINQDIIIKPVYIVKYGEIFFDTFITVTEKYLSRFLAVWLTVPMSCQFNFNQITSSSNS